MVDTRRSAPSRFVPTLTDVVQQPDAAAPVLPSPIPVRPPQPLAAPVAVEPPAAVVVPAAPPAKSLPDGFEEYVVHRVMQRVDLVLEQRLRDAIETVVLEQTRSLVPRLHEEVESVIRYSVYEAVAEELTGERTPD